MFLEIYVWSWLNLHPGHVIKKTAKLLGLAALVLVPLLYINISLVRQGFKSRAPSFNIEVSKPPEMNY